MSRSRAKIIGAVAGVIVCVVVVLILMPPSHDQLPPGGGSAPTNEATNESAPVTPSSNSTSTVVPPPGTIDWSQVEIKEVTRLEGTGVYQVGYVYPPVGGSWFTHFVYVDEEQYCSQAVNQAIEEDILARLAETQGQDQLTD